MLGQPKSEEGVHVSAIARALGGDPNEIGSVKRAIFCVALD